MGIVDVRPILGDRVDAAYYTGEVTVITKKGRPRAALVPYDWAVQMCKERGIPVPEPYKGRPRAATPKPPTATTG